jgi:hypothetical protein
MAPKIAIPSTLRGSILNPADVLVGAVSAALAAALTPPVEVAGMLPTKTVGEDEEPRLFKFDPEFKLDPDSGLDPVVVGEEPKVKELSDPEKAELEPPPLFSEPPVLEPELLEPELLEPSPPAGVKLAVCPEAGSG